MNDKNIAIIGGGWYGCHIASFLKKHNYDITIYEKEDELFKGVSGNYGIRLHIGPHYPRSSITRRECLDGFYKFLNEYPDLIINHESSFYGLGYKDVDNIESRIDSLTFRQVCEECPGFKNINIKDTDFDNLQNIYNVLEPSLKMEIIGKYFKNKIKNENIKLFLNYKVNEINNYVINNIKYDYIINCTYFKDFLPKQIPLNINIYYQSCLTLYYKDTEINNKPFSFTVMDGWYPCIMPYENTWKTPKNRIYVLYHAKYTILGTYKTIDEANNTIEKLTDEIINNNIKPLFEKDILKYYPKFKKRFEYIGYNTAIATKIKSQSEFRSTIVFSDNNMIHVFSGKVNNIFNAAEKVLDIVKYKKIEDFKEIQNEINKNYLTSILNTTCDLQTFEDLNI
jgi:hypothetical protein